MNYQPDLDLVDATFAAIYGDGDAPIDIDATWIMGVTLLADVLLRTTDEVGRERLLRGLVRELRAAMVDIQSIMRGGPYPRTPDDRHFPN